MDIRNFFSRKRKNGENGEKSLEPAKKKRKVSPNQKNEKENDNLEETENFIVPSIQSLDIQKSEPTSPTKADEDKEEEKRVSDDDEDDAMEEESDYDDDIDANRNSNANNTKLPSIILSKTK